MRRKYVKHLVRTFAASTCFDVKEARKLRSSMSMDGALSREMRLITVSDDEISYLVGFMSDYRYLDKAAEILANLCIHVSSSPERPVPSADTTTRGQPPTWILKANVTVFRHADRTPKQKLKFNFPIGDVWTQPFVRLLNGEKEEIILRETSQLNLIAQAVEEAKALGAGGDDLAKLTQLNTALFNKINLPGTKAQLKPVYSKRQAGQARRLTKLTLVFKWGGEVR